MLISEIEPNEDVGVDLLKEENPDEIIDKVVELPLRKACKIFARKGIRTLMSSANRKNILTKGQRPVEKQDIHIDVKEGFYQVPTFEEAGKGYAWIMLDFDTLSIENKDLLFSIEERKGKNGNNIGEKIVWFVHPCKMGNVEFDLKIGKYDYDFLRQIMPEEEIPKDIEVDPKLVEFEKRHIVLGYGGIYPTQSVFLRMPINEKTTVEEVEEYFANFAETFKIQTPEIPSKLPDKERED